MSLTAIESLTVVASPNYLNQRHYAVDGWHGLAQRVDDDLYSGTSYEARTVRVDPYSEQPTVGDTVARIGVFAASAHDGRFLPSLHAQRLLLSAPPDDPAILACWRQLLTSYRTGHRRPDRPTHDLRSLAVPVGPRIVNERLAELNTHFGERWSVGPMTTDYALIVADMRGGPTWMS
jgi:hypothetical protein